MSLQLDARQRAMLQEMGITIWQPAEKTVARAPVEPQRVQPPVAVAAAAADTAVLEALPPQVARQAPPERPQRPTAAPSVATPVPAPAQQSSTGAILHAAQTLYPDAKPDAIPAELGSGWLIVFEAPIPGEPLSGDNGKLLDNMLRAMQLHRHPRTYACVLERAGATSPSAASAGPAETVLTQTLAELRPSMVLILGLGAARAILDSREPLGRLRAMQHQLADGTPAVVSYDPAYLLRAPDAKASAWADLCRALAIVRKASAATP